MNDFHKVNVQYLSKQLTFNNLSIDKSVLENDLFQKAHNSQNGYFRSRFSRDKYYINNFNYVKPKCIVLNDNTKYYYIPIEETLVNLFKNSNFSTQYFDFKETSPDNTFSDITDGNSFKNNIFYKQNPNAL